MTIVTRTNQILYLETEAKDGSPYGSQCINNSLVPKLFDRTLPLDLSLSKITRLSNA
jgi:hypothetical protein